MSMTLVTKQAASLSANHPLGAILSVTPAPDSADPVASAAAGAMGALLLAGDTDFNGTPGAGGPAGGSGLTAAGVAAVLAAWNTYIGGLSAAKKAQVGYIKAMVTSAGLALSVHSADVAAQASSLQATLNTAANFGPVGS